MDESVILDNVTVGRYSRIKKAIVDKDNDRPIQRLDTIPKSMLIDLELLPGALLLFRRDITKKIDKNIMSINISSDS